MVLPSDFFVQFYTRANDFLAQTEAQAQLWEADVALHQDIVHQWFQGKSLPLQILDYWRSQSQRFALPNIAVVDYAMPAATGLEVLQAAAAWPTYRILLTGKADEYIAVDAFNDGLIDRYVTKQRPDLVQHFISVLRQLHSAPLEKHESVWRNVLRRSQQQALQDRAVQLALRDWIKVHRCVEYVVLPEPFGLLALDTNAQVHWLQFEMYKDLSAAVDLASAAGQSPQTLSAIAQGEALCDAEWLLAAGLSSAPKSVPTILLGTGGHLVAAHFPQPELGTVGTSHRAFIASLPKRFVDQQD